MPLIDPVLLKARLGPLAGRFDVDALAECDSTSSELLRRAERGAPSGTVIVADRQLAGRGRRGRSWLASADGCLMFSVLWRSQRGLAGLGGLSLAVGVALVRALEQLGATGVRLKWPNDVLLASPAGDAKLAGILIELAGGRREAQVCIGIGLNLQTPAGEFAQPVAGLAQALPALPERHQLLATILVALLSVLDDFAEYGFAAVKDEWQARHAWQDRAVRLIEDGCAERSGICRGVADDGALLLETATGCERILAGDVSLRVNA